MLLLFAALICFISSALSGITTTPGMQRKCFGQTATFQWSVTGSITSFSVYNQTHGYPPGPLNANAKYIMDKQRGFAILIIDNVQLRDAGNYSLSVNIGTTRYTDSSALLFVYGAPLVSVYQTYVGSGQQPATEGDVVELTCSVISTSLPVAYRPKIYYQWDLSWIGTLQNISSGPAKLSYSDDPIPGYSIKDDGKTLVIASVQYQDTQGIRCYGQEQWSPSRPNSYEFDFPLDHRPHITFPSPASRRFNAIVGDHVSLSFVSVASPVMTSATNWSFINTVGHAQDLPIGSSKDSSYKNDPLSTYTFSFTLTSEAYYGNYSITLNNSIGATTETFQVLGLGPPDAPSSVRATFVSHYLIVIAWNCMWSNGRQQTTVKQLFFNDSIIDTQNTTYRPCYHCLQCYNTTQTTKFQKGVQPETDYEIRIWSTNDLGSSEVIKLSVRTTKVFKFFVSPKTISLNGNQAIVNFSATEDKIAQLYVRSCLELTGDCDMSYYTNLNSTAGQIIYDDLKSGDVYIFDFTVFGADRTMFSYYYLTMVKGVRVSRNREVEGPPDAPSGVIADFVSHYAIVITWNCIMVNGRQQTTFLQLRSTYDDSVIGSYNTSSSLNCFTNTSHTQFQIGVRPESDYEVRVWSSNDFGSSDIVKLSVRTLRVFQFFVSAQTISFNGNQSIVRYNTTEGKIALLDITYCVGLSEECGFICYHNLNCMADELRFDITQFGDVYVFEFLVFGADSRGGLYPLTEVKGVTVSRIRETEESDGDKTNPLVIAVIVLGILLGVAVLALIGCIVAIIVFTSRQNIQPNYSMLTQEQRYG